MSFGTRVAKAFARGHNKLRSRFSPAGETMKPLSGSGAPYTTLSTYTNNFYLSKYEYTQMSDGKKYKWLRVEDVDGSRLSNLKAMTAVQVGSRVYKFLAKDPFIGAIPSYEFKVYPIERT
jgi:hypothetical protein